MFLSGVSCKRRPELPGEKISLPGGVSYRRKVGKGASLPLLIVNSGCRAGSGKKMFFPLGRHEDLEGTNIFATECCFQSVYGNQTVTTKSGGSR